MKPVFKSAVVAMMMVVPTMSFATNSNGNSDLLPEGTTQFNGIMSNFKTGDSLSQEQNLCGTWGFYDSYYGVTISIQICGSNAIFDMGKWGSTKCTVVWESDNTFRLVSPDCAGDVVTLRSDGNLQIRNEVYYRMG